VTARRTPLKYS